MSANKKECACDSHFCKKIITFSHEGRTTLRNGEKLENKGIAGENYWHVMLKDLNNVTNLEEK